MYYFIGDSPEPSTKPKTGGYSHCPSSAIGPSFLRSAVTLCGETPPENSALIPSPPKCNFHRVAQFLLFLCTSSHGPLPWLLYLLVPWILTPAVSEPFADCARRLFNRYYYTQWCVRGKESNLQVLLALHQPEWRHELTKNSVAGYTSRYVSALKAGTSPTYSGDC